jgi:phosphoadenosine phosphosulfate reductase
MYRPVAEGEDERAGRWKGQDKTECGIHNKRSKYAEYLLKLEEQQKKEQLEVATVEATAEMQTLSVGITVQ